jgi:hypothetical protein
MKAPRQRAGSPVNYSFSRWNGKGRVSVAPQSLRVSYDRGLTVQLNGGEIGDPPSFKFLVSTENWGPPLGIDRAPDAGTWSYPPAVPPARPTPAPNPQPPKVQLERVNPLGLPHSGTAFEIAVNLIVSRGRDASVAVAPDRLSCSGGSTAVRSRQPSSGAKVR